MRSSCSKAALDEHVAHQLSAEKRFLCWQPRPRALDATGTATMQFSSKTTAALSLLALLAVTLAKPCPAADANLKSLNRGDGKVSVTFRSQIDEELQVYWMTRDGEEHDVGILESLGEVMHQSFEGHAFRVRRMLGEKEVVAETLLGRSTRQRVLIEACGAALAAQSEAPLSPRAAEFEELLHAPDKKCEGPSHEWSCVRYLHEEDLRKRDPRDYGLQPGEVSKHREFKTVDESYVSQIPQIPRVTDGPGYAKMSFTQPLHDALTDWYQERRNDSMVSSGVLPTRALRHRRDAPRRSPASRVSSAREDPSERPVPLRPSHHLFPRHHHPHAGAPPPPSLPL